MTKVSKYDRSFILGVTNGVLFNLAEAMIGGTTVLPIFISKITASKVLIGLSGTMANAGLLMPQLIVANLIQHLKRFVLGQPTITILDCSTNPNV